MHFVDRVLTLAGRDDFHRDIERWKYQRIDTTVISDGVACFFLATQGRFHRLPSAFLSLNNINEIGVSLPKRLQQMME